MDIGLTRQLCATGAALLLAASAVACGADSVSYIELNERLLDTRPAIAALGASGKLARLVAGDDEDEGPETSGDEFGPAVQDDGEAIPLAADFGEDLVPADAEAEGSDQDARDRA